jgi:hypothetical protein
MFTEKRRNSVGEGKNWYLTAECNVWTVFIRSGVCNVKHEYIYERVDHFSETMLKRHVYSYPTHIPFDFGLSRIPVRWPFVFLNERNTMNLDVITFL